MKVGKKTVVLKLNVSAEKEIQIHLFHWTLVFNFK